MLFSIALPNHLNDISIWWYYLKDFVLIESNINQKSLYVNSNQLILSLIKILSTLLWTDLKIE